LTLAHPLHNAMFLPQPRTLQQNRSDSEPQGSSLASPLAGKRVVVVEDEGITQLQLRKMLTQAGMVVAAAASRGDKGVEEVLATKPDLVIMDIKMPGMDGLSAAETILRQYRVCIVMLTAFGDEEHLNRAWSIGACGYAIKPVSASSLLPLLAEAYARFHSEPS